jgi:hypothetical protein
MGVSGDRKTSADYTDYADSIFDRGRGSWGGSAQLGVASDERHPQIAQITQISY